MNPLPKPTARFRWPVFVLHDVAAQKVIDTMKKRHIHLRISGIGDSPMHVVGRRDTPELLGVRRWVHVEADNSDVPGPNGVNVTVYGELERPRVLVAGCAEDHPVAIAAAGYCPTVRFYEKGQLRLESWDVVISVNRHNGAENWAGHMRAIQFGGSSIGAFVRRSGTTSLYVRVDQIYSPGLELVVPDGLPKNLRKLVKGYLVPALIDTSLRFILTVDDDFTPLLTDLDDNPIAAIYVPDEGPGEVWLLPKETLAPDQWLVAALEAWSEQDPARFPARPRWSSNPEWMSIDELRLIEDLGRAEGRLEQAVADLDAERLRAQERLRAATESADQNERLLLTATDAELVDQVMVVMRAVGFDVTDMDVGRREKLEDLHARW